MFGAVGAERHERRIPCEFPLTVTKNIVLHDYFATADGGGRTSLALAQTLGGALAFAFRKHDHPYFRDGAPVRTIDLGCAPGVPLLRQLLVARAFIDRTGFLQGYDRAFYSGSYAPLALLRGGAARNIAYCHTPPRFVYDQRDDFMGRLAAWQRPLLAGFIKWFEPRFIESMHAMQRVLCNSEVVKQRIRRYLSLDATVVYPPCEVERFCWLGQRDYYLSTARLDRLKRVDLCIRAFRAMPDKRLLVVSAGDQESTLRALAAGARNIEVLGEVSERRLIDLIGGAVATLYLAVDEDFGLSPVESMAAGKPVIGAGGGGLLETLVDGSTATLLSAEPEVDEVVGAIREMTPERALSMRVACEARARRFSQAAFAERLGKVLAES